MVQHCLDIRRQCILDWQTDGILELIGFQAFIDLRVARRHPPESNAGRSKCDSMQLPVPAPPASPVTHSGLLHIAKLIEAKQRMVAGAAEMSVERRSFLLAIGLAHRTVHVQNEFPHRLAFAQPVNPFS